MRSISKTSQEAGCLWKYWEAQFSFQVKIVIFILLKSTVWKSEIAGVKKNAWQVCLSIWKPLSRSLTCGMHAISICVTSNHSSKPLWSSITSNKLYHIYSIPKNTPQNHHEVTDLTCQGWLTFMVFPCTQEHKVSII